jgi:hypothetical protein
MAGWPQMRRNEVSVGLATIPDSGVVPPHWEEQTGIHLREEETGKSARWNGLFEMGKREFRRRGELPEQATFGAACSLNQPDREDSSMR